MHVKENIRKLNLYGLSEMHLSDELLLLEYEINKINSLLENLKYSYNTYTCLYSYYLGDIECMWGNVNELNVNYTNIFEILEFKFVSESIILFDEIASDFFNNDKYIKIIV